MPIAAQGLISSSLTLIDNLMVGSLGETELAAVGIAIQIYLIHWIVMFGFTSGVSTFMAQFWGSQDVRNIKKATGLAICVCLAISSLFFLVAAFVPHLVMRLFTDIPELIELGTAYIRTGAPMFLTISITVPFTAALRTTQQTKLPLYISIVVFITNAVLNYTFIFGKFGAPQLGVPGSALGTVLARCLELTLVLFVVFVRRNLVAGRLSEYVGWNRELVRRIVKNAIPTTMNEAFWSIGTSMYVAAYARVGVTAYAAVQASNVINNLFTLAAFSIGDATLILVGQKLGQGKVEEAYELARKLLRVGLAVGVCLGLGLVSCSRLIIGLFELTPQGQQFAFYILLIYGAFLWLHVYNGIAVTGILRCGGDTVFAMATEMITIWLYAVPTAFITALALGLPIYVAVFFVKLEEIIKSVILVRRFRSKKWAKNVIHNIE
ncbi:MATE family efflux transporter [Aminipila butyrica]|uniref:Probable multidrug resistance protein NorM n=1 Tax=Aminipila butyrica TaxID=433296 RepID=A0A858C059_9FIRM|nr:MATE family efflux transporter [Aminipila butyrica]QIB70600.1 MATE family efflux transporter [Aminipila butyrica]